MEKGEKNEKKGKRGKMGKRGKRGKKIEKDGTIGKDRAVDLSIKVQELTDDYIKKIDEMLSQKENEIRQV